MWENGLNLYEDANSWLVFKKWQKLGRGIDEHHWVPGESCIGKGFEN